MNEIWKDLKNYEGVYKISNLGRIKSVARYIGDGKQGSYNKKEKIKSVFLDSSGYLKINLYKNNKGKLFYLHRIIAENFIENSLKVREVNHKDGNKLNNNISNLEWVTSGENRKHAYDNNLKSAKGELNGGAKLNNCKVLEIRKSNKSEKELADFYGVNIHTIRDILKRKTWVHI